MAFTIEFENRTRRRMSVPADLGSTFDNLILHIVRPDGSTYVHRPRGLACSTARILLAPGERLSWPFCTIRGPLGVALRSEGDYEVTAIAPALGVASLPVRFSVEDRRPKTRRRNTAVAALASAASARLLAPGKRRALAARYADADIDRLTRGYLALAQLALASSPAERSRLERTALAKSSPREVRYAAAIACARRLSAAGKFPARARRAFSRRYFEDPRDGAVVTKIMELGR